jgi:hypothetical protein
MRAFAAVDEPSLGCEEFSSDCPEFDMVYLLSEYVINAFRPLIPHLVKSITKSFLLRGPSLVRMAVAFRVTTSILPARSPWIHLPYVV